MRRLAVPRSVTVGALGALMTLLALVALPGIGIGDPTTSHGLSPSDVFTTTEPEICAQVDTFGTPPILPTEVSTPPPPATSNLVVYFTSEWSGLDTDTELLLNFIVTDGEGNFVVGTPFEWGLSNSPLTHDSGTVMWSFDNVQPGVYHVFVDARTDPVPGPIGGGNTNNNPKATLENCALTVFVSPIAPPPPIP